MLKDRYTITDGETKRDIKMSYGLLNVICKIVGELDGAALLALDNDLREAMLSELLAVRDATGAVTVPFNAFTSDCSLEEISGLLSWAQEHIYDFFVKSATKTLELATLHKPKLTALQGSFAGGRA